MTIRELRHERLRSKPLTLTAPRAEHSALLLLNWQPAVLAHDGVLHRKARETSIDLACFDKATERALHCLVTDLLPACRACGIDILHLPSNYWNLIEGSQERKRHWPHMSTTRQGLDVISDVQTQPEELTITSNSVSPFNSTRIDLILRNLQIEQLLIAGLLTNQSVELAAQDGRDRGYEVIVIEDACAAFTTELHCAALGRIRSSAMATARAAVVAERIRSRHPWPETVTNQAPAKYPILTPDPEPQLLGRAQIDAGSSSPALVTVDMQYLNAHPDWGVGRELSRRGSTILDDYFDSVRSILPTVRAVQDTFRKAQLPLIHLRTACQLADERDSGRHRRRNRDPMAALGTQETEFLPEVAPEDTEMVVNKTSWGVFNSTHLERILYRLSIRHIVLVGVVTNGCVEIAARDALDRDFKVTIVKDATATRSANLQLDALFRLETYGAIIQNSTSLPAYLAQHSRPGLESIDNSTISGERR